MGDKDQDIKKLTPMQTADQDLHEDQDTSHDPDGHDPDGKIKKTFLRRRFMFGLACLCGLMGGIGGAFISHYLLAHQSKETIASLQSEMDEILSVQASERDVMTALQEEVSALRHTPNSDVGAFEKRLKKIENQDLKAQDNQAQFRDLQKDINELHDIIDTQYKQLSQGGQIKDGVEIDPLNPSLIRRLQTVESRLERFETETREREVVENEKSATHKARRAHGLNADPIGSASFPRHAIRQSLVNVGPKSKDKPTGYIDRFLSKHVQISTTDQSANIDEILAKTESVLTSGHVENIRAHMDDLPIETQRIILDWLETEGGTFNIHDSPSLKANAKTKVKSGTDIGERQ